MDQSVTSDYRHASRTSRAGRAVSHDALAVLEHALAAPVPNRARDWRNGVVEALDVFVTALEDQARSDLGRESLLSEIAIDHPRLAPRIQRLHAEHRDLRDSAISLRHQIVQARDEGLEREIDTADIRDRLAGMARRFRQHRAREADLVYEAINVDLGGGD